MQIKNYIYHNLFKANKNTADVFAVFESVLIAGKLKSRAELGATNGTTFNGQNYVCCTRFVKKSEYKLPPISRQEFKTSKLSNKFKNYSEYLAFLKLDNWLKKPLSKESYFKQNNTQNVKDWYRYLDSINRTYPQDLRALYLRNKEGAYKYIIKLVGDEICWFYPNENGFEKYVVNGSEITLMFKPTQNCKDVILVPNMPSEIEREFAKKYSVASKRYSNIIGEVQIKNGISTKNLVAVMIKNEKYKTKVESLLKKYKINVPVVRYVNDKIVVLK